MGRTSNTSPPDGAKGPAGVDKTSADITFFEIDRRWSSPLSAPMG